MQKWRAAAHLGLLASEHGVVERRLQVRRHAVDDVAVGALHTSARTHKSRHDDGPRSIIPGQLEYTTARWIRLLGRSGAGSAHSDKGVGRNGVRDGKQQTNLDCHVGILGHPGHARHDPPVRLPLVPGTEHRLVIRPHRGMLPAAAAVSVRGGGQGGRARGDDEEEEGDKGGNDWERSAAAATSSRRRRSSSSHGPTSDYYCFVARGGGGGDGVAVAVGARRSPRCLYPTSCSSSSSSSSGAVGLLAHWRSACPLPLLLPSPGASRRREARTLAINTAA